MFCLFIFIGSFPHLTDWRDLLFCQRHCLSHSSVNFLIGPKPQYCCRPNCFWLHQPYQTEKEIKNNNNNKKSVCTFLNILYMN